LASEQTARGSFIVFTLFLICFPSSSLKLAFSNPRALIVEADYDPEHISSYHTYKYKPNAHFAFNFQFCSLNEHKSPVKPFSPSSVLQLIEQYQKHLPRDCWSNWQVRVIFCWT
jgi:hypothetical protein